MSKLEVEDSDDYNDAVERQKLLNVLKNYYTSDEGFEDLEMNGFHIRDMFGFMSDNEYPKKGFIDNDEKEGLVNKIEQEIENITQNLKNARLKEIKDKDLNSLLIIPSWSEVIGYKTKGFYLNKPVLDLASDAIVMLSYDILTVEDRYGDVLGLLTGPGILFTKFSISPGSYVINAREINMILLPIIELQKLLEAPPIFKSDIDITMNELISILPFNLIEEGFTKQAVVRGVMSRNVFHPNKDAFNTFLEYIESRDTVDPKGGFKILSAHKDYFNRLLLTEEPKKGSGDASFDISSAGIAAILQNGQKLLDELIPDRKDQIELLLKFKDMKFEFNKTGRNLIENWM